MMCCYEEDIAGAVALCDIYTARHKTITQQKRSWAQFDKCQEDNCIFGDALALKANDSSHGTQNRLGGVDHISLRCAPG